MNYSLKLGKVSSVSSSEKQRSRVVYICQQCGRESLKWLGRCPNCQEWNSFVETRVAASAPSRAAAKSVAPPRELSTVSTEAEERFPVSLGELDRVLGGGVVPGSLTLIGGEPGIGKSTLLLQAASLVAGGRGRVAYVSGEETERQIKLRAGRLGVGGEGLYVIAETDLEAVLAELEDMSPDLVVVDSIQTAYMPHLEGVPGSISQVKECTLRLMRWAKESAAAAFIAGHVTKDGAIAGPRVLEHIVDVVLYLEGERFSSFRLLRCTKNRFGSTNEVGVFEMKAEGLMEVANPSRLFLAERDEEAVGSVVVPTMEGSRPLLVEVQALTNLTTFGLPRRTANGVDFNRLLMLAAVLSRRAGLKLANQDIIVNVTGGLKVGEPAADIGIALAIASSYRDRAVAPHTAALGEVGLSGEVRVVSHLERRLKEAARLGFKRCIVPRAGAKTAVKGIEPVAVSTLREAIRVGLVEG